VTVQPARACGLPLVRMVGGAHLVGIVEVGRAVGAVAPRALELDLASAATSGPAPRAAAAGAEWVWAGRGGHLDE
jgi:hypothetical protein